jgi:predicted nucleic acid-binding Zn ribbon protein
MAWRRTNDEAGPEPLKEILSRLFTTRGWGRRQARLHLEKAWEAAAGPEYAPHTRLVNITRGIVEIEVANGVLLQELAHFQKRKLLEKLRATLTGQVLKDIRFRAASWQS